jgi:hypothetical protein
MARSLMDGGTQVPNKPKVTQICAQKPTSKGTNSTARSKLKWIEMP